MHHRPPRISQPKTVINRWLRDQYIINKEMKNTSKELPTQTVIEWLLTIEDKKVSELALKYLQSQPIINPAESFSYFRSALVSAFIWGQTPQGYKYWKAISKSKGKTPKIQAI